MLSLKKGESHQPLGLADRSLVLPSIPDPRSGLVPIHTPFQSLRPAGRVVLVPGAETAHGSLHLDSRALVAGPVLLLLSSSLLFCCRCSLVVAAASSSSLLLPRRRCCFLVVVAAPSSLLLLPRRRGCSVLTGSPPRHTPGRICFSLLSSRIRARRAYLPRRTHPLSRSSLASKHLRAYVPQDL